MTDSYEDAPYAAAVVRRGDTYHLVAYADLRTVDIDDFLAALSADDDIDIEEDETILVVPMLDLDFPEAGSWSIH